MNRLRSLIPLVVGLVLCCVYMAYGVTQEAPIGVVEGTVTMQESGKLLAEAMVYLIPQPYDAEGEKRPTRTVESDEHGHFKLKAVATGSYLINASTAAHELKA